MARKKDKIEVTIKEAPSEEIGLSRVLESNFMPYAMSVIISRAIPEIDGFKPSHRKLLYTMYRMGLMNGQRVKSTKAAGQTMALNPHGDASIYETLVRLTTGRETLLHPFIDSKGIFGKHYSDMPCAASRYTEVKLSKICEEVFSGIEKDAVDFVPNFDNTDTEPSILPVSFPNILVSSNTGIAVGMASNICSFNLGEICDATIAFINNPDMTTDELLDILKAPDFTTGGLLIYKRDQLREIYETGRGTFKIRSKYEYDAKSNRIEITEIPYTTTVEKIKDAIIALVKSGRIKDIADVRDEIDISGLRLTIDLKKSADAEKLMLKLYKLTSLEDSFPCNFNVLIGGIPNTMGILAILDEWIEFRAECLRRQFSFEYGKKSDKLHLLYGLKKILVDIDKAIKIIRNTESEKDVIPNLMSGFSIDKPQAEYIAEIKLRNLNREYILNRISETEDLEKEIADLSSLLSSRSRIKKYIASQLKEIKKKYAIPRKTFLLTSEIEEFNESTEQIEDYQAIVFLSVEGYFKKCLPASLRANDVQKYKEGDKLLISYDTLNSAEMLFFTSKGQVYKAKLNDFDTCKASALGDYIAAKLNFDEGEAVVFCLPMTSFKGNLVLFFENGKAVRISADAYQTKQNRKKLSPAFYSGSRLVAVFVCGTAKEYLVMSNDKRALLIPEDKVTLKSTRTSSGSTVFTLKKNDKIVSVIPYYPDKNKLQKESKYRKSNLPAAGVLFEDFDTELTQQTLF